MPHKRIVRNLRKLLHSVENNRSERDKHLEHLLLILPRGSADPLEVIRPKPEPVEGEFIDEDEEGENKTENVTENVVEA
jgi:hypothetical protein